MFTPEQYRAKAAEYTELGKTASSSNDAREFHERERSFTALADNEQWLTDHQDQTVRATEHGGAGEVTLAAEEERVLRCLGAALIMQWNTLPTKLQRELFDNASATDELLDTATLRGQIARFLHKHKDGEGEIDEHGGHTTKMTSAASSQSDSTQHAAAIARWDDEGGASKPIATMPKPIWMPS